jgi:hypothetical protein
VKAFLQIMDIELTKMLKDHQVMPVTLMVTEKNILASPGIIILPVGHRIPDSSQRRMLVILEGYPKFTKKFI